MCNFRALGIFLKKSSGDVIIYLAKFEITFKRGNFIDNGRCLIYDNGPMAYTRTIAYVHTYLEGDA